MTRPDPAIASLADLLRRSDSTLFITGAGISADSGLPTYRGIGGLYETETLEEGVPIEIALSGHMMNVNPALCWKYIAQVEAACRGARHNRGHEVLAQLESVISRVWVVTQNVDGFHRDAGSTNLVEIHGNLRELLCTRCTRRDAVPDYSGLQIPPKCPDCDGLVRPDVVLFGEMLPRRMYAALAEGFDLVVSIGTMAAFPYIAQPVCEAAHAGVPTVEINPGQSEISDVVDLHIRAGARDTLEAVWALLV
jgi:NAD-dependent deacetylase